jgi:hypothetical protein
VVDRAALLHLFADQAILAIQKQQAELLLRFAAHRSAAVVDDALPCAKHGLIHDRAFMGAKPRDAHGAKQRDGIVAKA